MNSKRFYTVMIVVIVLLGIGVLASAFLGNKMLEKKSKTIVQLKTDTQVLSAEELSLTQAKKDVKKYSQLQQAAQAIVPQDKDQASAVREIVKIAGASGVKIALITFPASTLGGTAKASGTADTSSTASLTQVQPVKGISGVFILPITIQNDSNSPISYGAFISFLGKLEQNRRTAQVASVTLQPTALNPSQLTFNLVLNVYIKP